MQAETNSPSPWRNDELSLLVSLLPYATEPELERIHFLITGPMAKSTATEPALTLYEYTCSAWPIIESAPFVDNWHIHAICEHLEAVLCGDIPKLLINIPPGCSKSLITSVFWPTWAWTHWPSSRWFFASYSQTLSTRDSVKSRILIRSKWYQERWGGLFSLTDDQNQKTYFENDKTGYRLATSVDGRGTGEHPDVIVVDDPHNVKESESDLERQAAVDWWDLTMSTRGASRDARRVIIMQRLHEEDLAGHVLGQNTGWEHICLPMRFEPDRMKATSLGWCDPRTEEGELLTPGQYDETKVAELEATLGSYGTAGQLQQRPSPKEGGRFKRNWWRYFEHDYEMLRTDDGARVLAVDCPRVIILDPANRKTKASKYTAIGVFTDLGRQRVAVLDMKREKLEVEEIIPAVYELVKKWEPVQVVGIEANGFQITLVREARNQRQYPLMPTVLELKAIKSKLQRATPAIIRCEQGQMYVPKGETWVDAFIEEHAAFTGNEKLDKYSDQVDVTAYGVITLERYVHDDGEFEFITGGEK